MKFGKYQTLFMASLRSNLAYFKSFLISKTFLAVILFVFFSLYRTLYAGRSAVDGLSLTALIYYLAVTESIELSRPRIHMAISDDIKDGTCAYSLLRPMSYLGYHYFNNAGEMVLNCLASLVVGVAMASLLQNFDPKLIMGIVFALPAIIMSLTLSFVIMINIGLLAFFIEEVAPIFWIYQKLLFVIGGLIIPIDFFPAWLQKIVKVLPTTYIQYFPAKMAVAFDFGTMLTGMLSQCAYICFFTFSASILYHLGMKRVEVNGG